MPIADEMNGILYVVVAVYDLDSAARSYQKLGFEVVDRSPRQEWGLEAVQLRVGAASRIELVAPVAEDRPVAQAVKRFLDKNGEGVYEIAVQVGDVDKVYEYVKDNGARIVAEPHYLPSHPDVKVVWISPRSTHGVFLEFISRSAPLQPSC